MACHGATSPVWETTPVNGADTVGAGSGHQNPMSYPDPRTQFIYHLATNMHAIVELPSGAAKTNLTSGTLGHSCLLLRGIRQQSPEGTASNSKQQVRAWEQSEVWQVLCGSQGFSYCPQFNKGALGRMEHWMVPGLLQMPENLSPASSSWSTQVTLLLGNIAA